MLPIRPSSKIGSIKKSPALIHIIQLFRVLS
jgi:hypothetical protein